MDIYDLNKDTLQTFWHEQECPQKGKIKENTCINEIINGKVRSRSETFKNNVKTCNAEIFDVKV